MTWNFLFHRVEYHWTQLTSSTCICLQGKLSLLENQSVATSWIRFSVACTLCRWRLTFRSPLLHLLLTRKIHHLTNSELRSPSLIVHSGSSQQSPFVLSSSIQPCGFAVVRYRRMLYTFFLFFYEINISIFLLIS
jgi:hypothetical protein